MKGKRVVPTFLLIGLLFQNLRYTCSFSVAILPGRNTNNARKSPPTRELSRGSQRFATSFDSKKEFRTRSALIDVNIVFKTLVSRLDTLNAARLSNTNASQRDHGILLSGIGLVGHSGLLLASTILVMLAKAFWKTVQQSRDVHSGPDEAISSGPMDRCPWPFIFSHDPMQGIKDPPTWILITWYTLWRILKASRGKV